MKAAGYFLSNIARPGSPSAVSLSRRKQAYRGWGGEGGWGDGFFFRGRLFCSESGRIVDRVRRADGPARAGPLFPCSITRGAFVACSITRGAFCPAVSRELQSALTRSQLAFRRYDTPKLAFSGTRAVPHREARKRSISQSARRALDMRTKVPTFPLVSFDCVLVIF